MSDEQAQVAGLQVWLAQFKKWPSVAPLVAEFGFQPTHTGGGCTCLEGAFVAQWVVITDDDSSIPESADSTYVVGFYADAEAPSAGEPLRQVSCGNLEAALQVLRAARQT